MVRSVWKGPFVDGHLIKKVQTHLKESNNKPFDFYIKSVKRIKEINFTGILFLLKTCLLHYELTS